MKLQEKNIKEDNVNWPQLPDHPYWTLITGSSESWKINSLLILISHQPDTDKIYLYEKDKYEAKYQLFIKKHEIVGLSHSSDPNAFIKYANDMDFIAFPQYINYKISYKTIKIHRFFRWNFWGRNVPIPANYILTTQKVFTKLLQSCINFCQLFTTSYHLPSTFANYLPK